MNMRRTTTQFRRSLLPWAVPVLLLALVPLASNIGGASIPDPSDVIHTCYDRDGRLRVIDTADVSGFCTALEKPLFWNQTGPEGPQGPPGTGALLDLEAITVASPLTTSQTSFVDAVPGATVTVPAGDTATIVVTFTAMSACYGADGHCSIQVLIDGAPANPDGGTGFAFDSSDNNTETDKSSESHSVTRVAKSIAAGDHTVTVQWAVSVNTITFAVDDSTTVIQVVKDN
jgi:hypothetical protein